jgi:hypothetical protein
VQPADYVVMAVPLTAGHHLFRLEYAPASYTIGRWVSIGSVVVFACLAVVWGAGVRRRRVVLSAI